MKGVNKLAVALVFGLTFGSTMQLHAGNEQRCLLYTSPSPRDGT